MEFDEGNSAVNEAVDEAINLIEANHAGANPNEAREFLIKAGEELKV